MNAAGNVILANDRFAAVHPEMEPDVLEEVRSHLGVEVTRLTLGGIKTVGMAGYATNRGVLVHARAFVDERLAQMQIGLLFADAFHVVLVRGAVGLSARRMDGGSLGCVQHRG